MSYPDDALCVLTCQAPSCFFRPVNQVYFPTTEQLEHGGALYKLHVYRWVLVRRGCSVLTEGGVAVHRSFFFKTRKGQPPNQPSARKSASTPS